MSLADISGAISPRWKNHNMRSIRARWSRVWSRFVRCEAVRCLAAFTERRAASASEVRIARRLSRSMLTSEVKRASRSRMIARSETRREGRYQHHARSPTKHSKRNWVCFADSQIQVSLSRHRQIFPSVSLRLLQADAGSATVLVRHPRSLVAMGPRLLFGARSLQPLFNGCAEFDVFRRHLGCYFIALEEAQHSADPTDGLRLRAEQ